MAGTAVASVCSDKTMPRRIGAVVGAITGAAAILLLLAGCIGQPDRNDSRLARLPLGIPEPVVASCEQSAGLGGSAPVTQVWREVDGIHVRIGLGNRAAGSSVSPTELALKSCLTIAVGSQPVYPIDASGRLLQWKYSTTVLWPCFVAHDADLGETPSRATFLAGDPLQIDPYYLLRSPLDDLQSLQLQRDCPLVPSYLKATEAAG
jgi:hypothetical protein